MATRETLEVRITVDEAAERGIRKGDVTKKLRQRSRLEEDRAELGCEAPCMEGFGGSMLRC